jgi:hypothetical protein
MSRNSLKNKAIYVQIKKIPGFDIIILNTFYYQLTGQRREHITKLILNDHLQVINSTLLHTTMSFYLGY